MLSKPFRINRGWLRPPLEDEQPRSSIYEQYLKRPVDVFGAASGLLLLSPLILTTGIAVFQQMGRPVLFRQSRPGMNEVIFTLLKFRTMRDDNGDPDKERVTALGRYLRTTSLDELPQMINILKGEMSFIGPRPLAVQYLPYYSEKERRRHAVRPGITGLAQVTGRNGLTWEQRFELDLKYVSKVTFVMDAKIVIKTIQKVLKKDGIVARGEGVVRDFDAERRDVQELRGAAKHASYNESSPPGKA